MKKLILTLGLIAGLNCIYAAPIHDAARNSKFDELKSLIDQGADVNQVNTDLLNCANAINERCP